MELRFFRRQLIPTVIILSVVVVFLSATEGEAATAVLTLTAKRGTSSVTLSIGETVLLSGDSDTDLGDRLQLKGINPDYLSCLEKDSGNTRAEWVCRAIGFPDHGISSTHLYIAVGTRRSNTVTVRTQAPQTTNMQLLTDSGTTTTWLPFGETVDIKGTVNYVSGVTFELKQVPDEDYLECERKGVGPLPGIPSITWECEPVKGGVQSVDLYFQQVEGTVRPSSNRLTVKLGEPDDLYSVENVQLSRDFNTITVTLGGEVEFPDQRIRVQFEIEHDGRFIWGGNTIQRGPNIRLSGLQKILTAPSTYTLRTAACPVNQFSHEIGITSSCGKPFVLAFEFTPSASFTSSVSTGPPAGFEDEVLTNTGAYENPFPDTNLNDLAGQVAAQLYNTSVVGGYPDGEFKGTRPVNRAEAAKFLLLARYETVSDVSNNGQFPDVLDNQWYTKFVVTAAQKNIINGHPDGTFRPADTVNTAEFLKMLSRTFDLEEDFPYSYRDVPATTWFAAYTGSAERYDLFPQRQRILESGKLLTRNEVAVAIYQYLRNSN